MRLGSYYRTLLAARLGFEPAGPRVLDVGAGDGLLLRSLSPDMGVALDPNPDGPPRAVAWVRGDARSLPFARGSFDAVYAFDVLEHVEDDGACARELLRVLRPGGTLWVSVPSRDFRAFPPFFTRVLHKSWGHVRPGYLREGLERLLRGEERSGVDVRTFEWNEPWYRAAYLPAKLVSLLSPPFCRLLLRGIARLDSRAPSGRNGHYFCRIRKGTPS